MFPPKRKTLYETGIKPPYIADYGKKKSIGQVKQMLVLPMHQRLAELWTLQVKRMLTPDEKTEFNLCLEANASWVWKKIAFENLSELALNTEDKSWQQELQEKAEKWESRP
jgi:hypothetical protein